MYEKILYQTVMMNHCPQNGQAEQFSVNYYLLSEENEKKDEKFYGVFIEKVYANEEKKRSEPSTVALMTSSKEAAIRFLECIVKGTVTPCGFLDVVLDCLSVCQPVRGLRGL